MRPRLLVPAVLAVLLLAGCGGSDDPAPASPDGPSDTAAPSAPASPAAEPATLGPCDLLEPADYRRYLSPGFRGAAYEVEGLDIDTGTFRTCDVRASKATLLSWGYSLDPDVWTRVKAHTRPEVLEEVAAFEGLSELLAPTRYDVMVGDQGFLFQTFGDLEGWFRIGDVALSFRPTPSSVPSGLTGADYGSTMAALAVAAGDASTLDMTPVDLPATCPPADDPDVVAVVGEVLRASGSTPDGLPASCDYAGASGALLTTAGVALPAPTFATELGIDLAGSEVLEDGRARRTELYVEPGGTGASVHDYLLPQRVLLDVQVGAPAWGPQRVAVDREALVRVARAYHRLSAPAVAALD